MVTPNRSSIVGGLVLIFLGLVFFVLQVIPGLAAWVNPATSWPLIIIGIGILFILVALVANIPGMTVPGSIIGGIGALLYWQNVTGSFVSWAYAWTLIPGFVGFGILLMGLLGEQRRRSIESGLWLMLISAVMFAVFGSFFGALGVLGNYWALLLIGLGLLLLVRPLLRSH